MTGVFLLVMTVAVFGFVGLWERTEKLQSRYDRLAVTHSRTLNLLARERQHHLKCAVRAVKAERRVVDLEAALVEAGGECATHVNNLTAVMDAVTEGKPLTLVRGGSRG